MGEIAFVISLDDTSVTARAYLMTVLLFPLALIASPIWRRTVSAFYRFDLPELPKSWISFRRRDCERVGLPT